MVARSMEIKRTKTGEKRVRRKLATVLAADVANYSAMVAASEEETIRALQIARRTFSRFITNHNGRIANTAGDSILAVFESPVEAVRCAVEVQLALQDKKGTTKQSKIPPVRFRIGVHLGDILLDGYDVLGDAVNIAARLEAASQPGKVCMSATIRDQIGNRFDDYAIRDLGEKSLKNIPNPIRVYELLSEKSTSPIERRRDLHFRRIMVMIAAVFIVIGAVGLGIMAAQSLKVALMAQTYVSDTIKAEENPSASETYNGDN